MSLILCVTALMDIILTVSGGVQMAKDKYLTWLKKKRLLIMKIKDKSIRKLLLQFHDHYAEDYAETKKS